MGVDPLVKGFRPGGRRRGAGTSTGACRSASPDRELGVAGLLGPAIATALGDDVVARQREGSEPRQLGWSRGERRRVPTCWHAPWEVAFPGVSLDERSRAHLMFPSRSLASLAVPLFLLTGFQTEAAPDMDLSSADLQSMAQALGCPSRGARPMLTAALPPDRVFACDALTRFARGKAPSPLGERRSFLGAASVVAKGRVQGTFLLLDDTGALFDDITRRIHARRRTFSRPSGTSRRAHRSLRTTPFSSSCPPSPGCQR